MEITTNEDNIVDGNIVEEAEVVKPTAVSETTEDGGDSDVVNEEIMFQRIMSYKAYRRGMIMTRALITIVAAIALVFTSRFYIILGIILPIMAIIAGAISILVSMGNERSYTVYNTRIVIKRRGDDTRKSVPLENIVSVKYKSAFYEKRMCVGTVTIGAKDAKGKVKSYKLKHVFDAKPVVEYLTGAIDGRNTTDVDNNRE
ncbi:MAG: hypothetical protein K2O04_05495 [Clostridiales bacterium]|nr:hypothetical protein [Clostridiales bacterium]